MTTDESLHVSTILYFSILYFICAQYNKILLYITAFEAVWHFSIIITKYLTHTEQ